MPISNSHLYAPLAAEHDLFSSFKKWQSPSEEKQNHEKALLLATKPSDSCVVH